MTTENENQEAAPEATAEQTPKKRTMSDIRRGGKKKSAQIATSQVAEDKTPEEYEAEGYRLLAYLGPESVKDCYRTTPHVRFEPTEYSNGHAVAWVKEPFGDHLIENAFIRNYESGKPREPEDWLPAYQWFDELGGRKISPLRRAVGAK